jgi:hypothetical protein
MVKRRKKEGREEAVKARMDKTFILERLAGSVTQALTGCLGALGVFISLEKRVREMP